MGAISGLQIDFQQPQPKGDILSSRIERQKKLVKVRAKVVNRPVRHVPIGRDGGIEEPVPDNPEPD